MTQTWALFVDAYRELNAKKLFWFVLAISLLVVVAFAMVGINEKGLTFLWWSLPVSEFNTTIIEAGTFYKIIFVNLGVKLWLAWAATILALVSTAPIIPDFLAGGAIELTLSKPIRRVRLFLTKYLTGLLFVGLQVTVFTTAAFVAIGLRGGSWEPMLFLSVPLVVCFFSYLYCFCALIGLLTRSTIASLLVTCLLWFMIFVVHLSESSLLMFRTRQEIAVEVLERDLAALPGRIEDLREKIRTGGSGGGDEGSERGAEEADAGSAVQPAASPADAPAGAETEPAPTNGEKSSERTGRTRSLIERLAALLPAPTKESEDQQKLKRLERELERKQARLPEEEASRRSLQGWHRLVFRIKSVLPKTSETMDYLELKLISATETEHLQGGNGDGGNADFGPDSVPVPMRDLTARIDQEKRKRTLWWVVGTSLAFEGALLAIGGWLFARRDF